MNSRIRRPLYIFPLNPDYVAARSLRSLRSNKTNKELNEINLKEIKDHKSDQSDFYCTSPTALSSEVMANCSIAVPGGSRHDTFVPG